MLRNSRTTGVGFFGQDKVVAFRLPTSWRRSRRIHSWIFYLLMCFPVFLQWTFSSLRIHIFMCFRCVLPEYSFAQILVEHRASETISVTAENMDLPIWHYASSIKEISSNFNYAFSIHTFC